MTTYNKIRAIRNHLIPQKLEFGCEVVSRIKDGTQEFHHILSSGNKIIGTTHYPTCEYSTKSVNSDLIIEILGKPLTTNDILLMLNKKNLDISLDLEWASGILVVLQKMEGFETWIDLTKSIENQTEDTLSAILSLVE